MTGTEISVLLWGLTTTGSLAAVFFKTRSDIRHLGDIKADKNNGLSEVKEIVVRIEEKVDEQGKKIETIFDKATCFQPNFKSSDCGQ